MIFSLRQLQEKCREQGKILYVAFIDLTKAFDLVSRDGRIEIMAKDRLSFYPTQHREVHS